MPAVQDEVWTTQQGKQIAIKDLHPDHAKNIIRLMLRKQRKKELVLEVFQIEHPQLVAQLAMALDKTSLRLIDLDDIIAAPASQEDKV